jgi:hypothetical protein
MGSDAKHHINDVIDKLKIAKIIARQNIEHHQEKNKENYDKKAKEPEFRVGQTLLLRVYKIPKGLSRKLPDKSDGPINLCTCVHFVYHCWCLAINDFLRFML